MPDDWGRERAQPVAVGPPRRGDFPCRTDPCRSRPAQAAHRERLLLAVLVVIVVGAVFLGSKLWHTVFGSGSTTSPATVFPTL